MTERCLACGVEKDPAVMEYFPYDCGIDQTEPIEPLFAIDCQPTHYGEDWRRVTVCHACFHKLGPDMWIAQAHWEALDPKVTFKELPRLEPCGSVTTE